MSVKTCRRLVLWAKEIPTDVSREVYSVELSIRCGPTVFVLGRIRNLGYDREASMKVSHKSDWI